MLSESYYRVGFFVVVSVVVFRRRWWNGVNGSGSSVVKEQKQVESSRAVDQAVRVAVLHNI